MNILVTGCAGFVGFHVSKVLSKKFNVIGIDNCNSYYSKKLKKSRLKILQDNKKFIFKKIDISNEKKLFNIFKKNKFQIVINLAAQAGVRYSITNAKAYTKSNLVGFSNILEACRTFKIKHLISASTSSVYGNSKKKNLSENLRTDAPIQYYAATKKANEVMAYSYSRMYAMNITMLRFFTVYGPWGRPDMALYKFTKKIINGEKIEVYNYGKHSRGFTYIDTITYIINKIVLKKINKNSNFEILNIGGETSIGLMKFINILEKTLNKKAKIKFLKLQPGDIKNTHANLNKIKNKYLKNYKQMNIESGIQNFVKWYKQYHKI